MSISVSQLEGLSDKLHRLSERLRSDRRPAGTALGENDPLVAAANDCDFLLPSPLTIDTLSATVEKKIGNVAVLLERARMHEQLPPDAQAAAEEENVLMDEDYQGDAAARKEGGGRQPGAAW
ncbi:MAG TPA: hypothetical protein VGU61_12280 [Noviherbaspirillum sp.]|jgi:hypothetical protein|uniref:hypothetical protein n=1 Tax=Noviherbaspirillum sp. TaxID=1926288 RepID=UPI002DDCEDEE|nr:hypothetical protein [Noviherbaspirillum sp.]HEV2611037.1 hypothetical protein [Noviherbaspirillum sp.]